MNNLRKKYNNINGVSYKQLRTKSRNTSIKLNNGEPLDLAIKKIISQLFVIAIVILSVFLIFLAIDVLRDKLTNNSVFSLSVSKKYSTPVSYGDIVVKQGKNYSAYSVLEALTEKLGDSISPQKLTDKDEKDITVTASGLDEFINQHSPNTVTSLKKNISNYTYLIEIYENIMAGKATIVPMALPEFLGNEGIYTYGYGLVLSVDFLSDRITVANTMGRTDVYSTESFIAATRFTNYKMPLDMKLSFILGIRQRNTALFLG